MDDLGGGGYWVNPGAGNRNWWFAGWQVQCQLLINVTPGVEIFHKVILIGGFLTTGWMEAIMTTASSLP